MPIRLIIADDHPMLIDGVIKLIAGMEDFELLEPAHNGIQLIDRLHQAQADILLLDLQMPHMDGIDTLRVLARDFPRLKVIIFTNYHQPALVREIRQLGAKAYLLKDSSSAQLKETIAAVASGETVFPEKAPASDDSPYFQNDFTRKYNITRREVEIIKKIGEGLTTKEISEQLFLSEFTVNTHRRNICRKLNIYTPVGLVNFAREHGLI
ncbi:MAG: response regulator transcription factor [Bacteroidetes bacterium]|nr:response regulator transcription factor [Bacteroidota bacterium]